MPYELLSLSLGGWGTGRCMHLGLPFPSISLSGWPGQDSGSNSIHLKTVPMSVHTQFYLDLKKWCTCKILAKSPSAGSRFRTNDDQRTQMGNIDVLVAWHKEARPQRHSSGVALSPGWQGQAACFLQQGVVVEAVADHELGQVSDDLAAGRDLQSPCQLSLRTQPFSGKWT